MATCLSSTGRSRLELPEQKIVFSYASILDSKKKNWRIAAEIPLYGEELVELDWNQAMKIKANGLRSQLDKSVQAQLAGLQKFLKLFGNMESWNCKRTQEQLNCRNEQEKITLDLQSDGYEINLPGWKISATQLNSQNFFEKIVLQGQNDSTSWHFFVSSCQ